ncbi:MAG: carbon monoxide dehydrogenase subunit G [Streptosporangiales bacterium]|nr:carbon monoxide dehydrogenase subunit G [Streptosporangiales bacterium]
MKVSGDASLQATPDRVYAALTDPAVLVRTIPGCESLEALGDDRYRASVTAGVASVRGTYDGEVSLAEQRPPESFVLHAKGSGAPGTVDATVRVGLAAADGGTRLSYDADAVVGGMVGGVGQRMLASAARRLAADFFAAVDVDLSEPHRAMAPSGSDEPATTTYRAPARRRRPATAPGLLAAAATGAAIALAGVAVGWRLGRRHQPSTPRTSALG